tara:strand:- start:1283 stop:1816 length:534 start_codon:yes stop_codon:yes gene_type:complete
MNKVVVIIGCALGLFVGILCLSWVSTTNKEVDLTNNFKAQNKVCEGFHDKMWKILKQQAQITDKYANDFSKVYNGIMEGRYSSGGGLMKWVQERNPKFDASMYKKLMVSVEAQREGFFREQKKLVDLQLSHDNLRMKFPSRLFVGGAKPLEVKLITSGKTKRVFETGEENDIDLFTK